MHRLSLTHCSNNHADRWAVQSGRRNLFNQDRIFILLIAFPAADNVYDITHWLPIHDAASYHGVEVFAAVAEASPENISAALIRGSVAHFVVLKKKVGDSSSI